VHDRLQDSWLDEKRQDGLLALSGRQPPVQQMNVSQRHVKRADEENMLKDQSA
jgi:hypothetical protein